MENKISSGNLKAISLSLSLLMIVFILSPPLTHASLVFLDDFEDGDASGWQETIIAGSGGSGTFGVEFHNESNMAQVYHRGEGSHSLSHDFYYTANSILSFDMQATAVDAYNFRGTAYHANCGVRISFLNFLNNALGTLVILNATNPDAMPDDYVIVDSTQNNYTGLMSDFAYSAGLSSSDPISKISLEYYVTGDYYNGQNMQPNVFSFGTVFFDNVSINAVPIPAAVWLLGSGLIGLAGVRRFRSRKS
jgi:hypothetical protein